MNETAEEFKPVLEAARKWYETEREMIAKKNEPEKQRQHHFAKLKLRAALAKFLATAP